MEVSSYRLLGLADAFTSRTAFRKSLLMEAISFRVGNFFKSFCLPFSIGDSL